MAPFFKLLFPGFRPLRDAVFPPGKGYTDSPITHDAIITIFNDMLSNLPEEHRVAAPISIKPKPGVKHSCEFLQCF